MRRSIAIVIGLVIIATAGVLIMFRGGRESTVDKTEVDIPKDTVDSSGNIKPAMDELLGQYTVDSKTGKAELLFEVDGLKNTQGAFEKFSVSLNVPDDFTKSELTVDIQAKSINTENEMRDEHLVEPDFFDVKKFPKIAYSANAISFADSLYTSHGLINFIGIEKELDFTFRFVGGKDLPEKRIEVFEGEFVFNRIVYGMEESSGIGNEVTVSFYVEMERIAS